MEIANLECGAFYGYKGRIVRFEESHEEREDSAGYPVFEFTAMDNGEAIQMSTEMVRRDIGPRVKYRAPYVLPAGPRLFVSHSLEA